MNNHIIDKKIFDYLKNIKDKYNFLVQTPSIHYLFNSKISLKIIRRLIKNGEIGCLEMAIENGFDINRYKYNSFILLEMAIYYEQIEIIKLLIASGIEKDYSSRDCMYITEEMYQDYKYFTDKCELNFYDLSNAFYKKNFYRPPLYSAVRRTNNLEIVKVLTIAGFPINYKSKVYPSALSVAILYNNFDIVKYLVENGAEINENSDERFLKPIDIAKKYQNKSIFYFLFGNINHEKIKFRKHKQVKFDKKPFTKFYTVCYIESFDRDFNGYFSD
jgi:ankyrin repeat protein